MTLTVGSLFSGIGGLDLGLERAGMNVIWQSEIDPYACRVLSKHWPEVPNHGDIKTINWGNVVRPDVICGGYPCQPFSQAGKRRGEDDPRHLWPWVRDAISELRPRYAVLENVRGHVSLGLSTVLGELAHIGYDAEWTVISAASLGAPHLRERVIIVAYPQCKRNGQHRIATDAAVFNKCWTSDTGRETRDVIGQWWENQPSVGRVAYGIPHRVDRLRGLGNAVVPQVAQFVGALVIDHANIANN
jgi:DNA (cytosine-5)-methyltransferase 1